MRSKTKVAAGVLAGAVAAAAVLTAGINHKATYAVFKNLTARKLKLDENAPWSGGRIYEHLPYAGDSESQYLDLYIPNIGQDLEQDPEQDSRQDTKPGFEKPGLFVMVHGGGFIAGDSQSRQSILMYRYFRDHGYACASINYRLAQEAPFPAGVEDVKAAVRFLQSHADEYGYDASRTAIWGESAGGYLAMTEAFSNENEFMGVRYRGQDEDDAAGKFYAGEAAILIDYYGAADLGTIWTSDSDWKKMFKFPRYPCGAFPSVTLTIPGMFFGSKLRLTIGISTDCANNSSAKNHHFREQASSFFMFVRFI